MTLLESIFLGLVQGITEFLPISSSGHLVLMQHLLGVKQPGLVFEIYVHFGTLIAVFIVFRKELWSMFSSLPALFISSYRNHSVEQQEALQMIKLVIVASIPTACMGFLLRPVFESLFQSVKSAGIGLLITGTLLWIVEIKKSGKKSILKVGWLDALLIGTAQGIAMAPGISRSGTTIATALFRQMDRETAAKFSFILSIPPILGAILLDAKDVMTVGSSSIPTLQIIVATSVAAISGLFAIKYLLKILRTGNLRPFSMYCWSLGFLILLFL